MSTILCTGEVKFPRKDNGTFLRTRNPFSLENFDDGYIDNRGRFRVWLPDHPRAYKGGYILRSIVAYEAYHGVVVFPDMDIHHKDGDRLNDSKDNLEMISHSKHSKTTRKQLGELVWVTRICKHCRKEFLIKSWRLKDSSRGQYCSQKCYHESRRK